MPACLSCGTELNADFGMVVCHNCGVMCSVDINGEVSLAEAHPAPNATEIAPAGLDLVDTPEYSDILNFASGDASGGETSSVGRTAQAPDTDASLDPFSAVINPRLVSGPASGEDLRTAVASFASEIADQGGLLRYDLEIGKIDSKERRQLLRDALTDARMGFKLDEVMSSIKSGRLVLRRVSATKSTLILQRLKATPLSIRWKQYPPFT